MRDLLTDYLEMLDFKVMTAENGKAALEIFNENNGAEFYDLIITDVNMPEMGGVELYKNIRKDNPDFPIVFMTGFGVERVKFELADINGILAKPFDLDRLSELIAGILGEEIL